MSVSVSVTLDKAYDDKAYDECRTPVLVLDDGEASGLDAFAATVAVFGQGRFLLLYTSDRTTLLDLANEHPGGVIVVDVDRDPRPKDVLAELADTGLPVVVLTDGSHDAISDHALSVGAAACLPTSLPARTLLRELESSRH